MKIQTSKTIKNFILDPRNDLDELLEYIEVDTSLTTEGILNALFTLLCHYDQNRGRVDYLIILLERVSKTINPNELQPLLGQIIDFNNKISHWSIKKRIAVSDPYQRIQNIFLKINNDGLMLMNNCRIKSLSYLIFEDKNLAMIDTFLNSEGKILNSKNHDGDNIFSLLLKRYLYQDEKDTEEINYLYHVIILFMKSKYRNQILRESNAYLKIIKDSNLGYKEHVIKVIELLDPSFTMSLQEIEERYNKRFDFPAVILNEIKTFKMDSQERCDFTDQECLTIDSSKATCLDDAQYIEQNLDGSYTLYIHIVDIPSFIPYDSLTNEEARLRSETLYLRDRNILLYPDYISNYKCSLLPNNERNTITYIFQLDPTFHLIEDSYKIVRGKIRVRYKLSYEEADKIIQSPNVGRVSQILKDLYLFSNTRRNSNKEKEKYRNYQNAVNPEQHHESLRIDHSKAANIVHEAMILVNYTAAKHFKSLSLPYIYRKIEMPSKDFIDEQLRKLAKLDDRIIANKGFINNLKDSYVKALYSAEATYHNGLNLSCYSHSSSPARRYADSYGQYLLYDLIFDKNLTSLNIQKWEYQINNLVKYLNSQKKVNERFESHYNYLSYRKRIKSKTL